MVFQISHVAYPQRRDTLKVIGEARLTTKRIKTLNTKHFDISVGVGTLHSPKVFHNRSEIGLLHLFVQPLYAQSRDCTADMENVNQLQPNAFISPKKEVRSEGEGASARDDRGGVSSPLPATVDSEAGSVAQPQLRKNLRSFNQGQGSTFRSVTSSQRNTLHLSFTSGASSIPGVDVPNSDKADAIQVEMNEDAVNPSVHSPTTSPLSPVSERNYTNSNQDSLKHPASSPYSSLSLGKSQTQDLDQGEVEGESQELDVDLNPSHYSLGSPDLNSSLDQNASANPSPNPGSVSSRSLRAEAALTHVEIKKVATTMVTPPATSEEPKYISQCHAIIRKSRSMYKQGVHLISRPRNDYVENMKFVL